MITKKCGCTAATCGCCEGTQALTPVSEINRPGLSALTYRAGTHGSFLETMLARLATMTVNAPGSSGQASGSYAPLLGLTTRDPGDPAIALLDCWATVADVLTFYQERIANEGYLRTATERLSLLQLARLIGYTLRPGVASSVYLAYTLDANQTAPVDIPAGSQSQSIPGPGELPQTFETSNDLTARTEWNNLQPRMTQPQIITSSNGLLNTQTVYFQGTTTNLNPGDGLLFQVSGVSLLCHVATVLADFTKNVTTVTLQEPAFQPPNTSAAASTSSQAQISKEPPKVAASFAALSSLLSSNLPKPPTLQLASSAFLNRSVGDALSTTSDTLPQALSVMNPRIASTIYDAWANSAVTNAQPAQVFAFRVKASPFGAVAPLKPITNDQGIVVGTEEWPINMVTFGVVVNNTNLNNLLSRSSASPQVATFYSTVSGQTSSAAVTLSIPAGANADTAWSVSQTIPLGEGAVQISLSVPIRTGQISLVFIFSYPSTSPTATATITVYLIGNSSQQVNIGSDPIQNVNPGQTLTTSPPASAYEASFSLSTDSTALTVEVDLPVPQDPLDVVFLDAQYNQIQMNTCAAIVRTDNNPQITNNPLFAKIKTVQSVSKAAYGITGKSTKLCLDKPWLYSNDFFLSVMRGATVYAQSENLPLAQQPFCPNVNGNPPDVQGSKIELDQLYDGLTSGRWIIVSGERTDILNSSNGVVTGVTASELAMISVVTQTYNPSWPGDQIHTTITLAKALAYTYSRATVTIYGNVVDATNGTTTNETLGNGDATQTLQSFALKQPPLTYVASPTPAGATSTLEVFVNNVQWTEVATLDGLGPKARNFITQTDNNAITTVIFGDGVQGALLPTGVGNVQAIYRNGIGTPGNVEAGEITLLKTTEAGVQSVLNPLDASGGADSDTVDQARANAPFAVKSLDRLVSVQDYADFSCTFAGIGKAASVRLSNGLNEVVYVTIAGADDVAIDTTSYLYINLQTALVSYGDPAMPVQVGVRQLKIMVVSARVSLLPDYQWDSVSLAIRTTLLSAFSFQTSSLAQPVILSQVVSVIQGVAGVQYVDMVCFGSLAENFSAADLTNLAASKKVSNSIPSLPARLCTNSTTGPAGNFMPAQLVYLTPAVPDTLILNQIT
jgi:hypothetical protein